MLRTGQKTSKSFSLAHTKTSRPSPCLPSVLLWCGFYNLLPSRTLETVFSIKVFLKPSEGEGAALWALASSIMKCSRVKESSQSNPNYWKTITGNPIHLLHWLSNGILSNEAGHHLSYKGNKLNPKYCSDGLEVPQNSTCLGAASSEKR